jgi:O-antigen/teichoic acid export membrane protein
MSKVTFSKASVICQWEALRQRVIGDKLVVNAIYIFGNVIVNSFTGFLFWTFASRLYTTSQVGIASSFISVIQLLTFISQLGLGIGMARFLPEDESPKDLFNSIILLSSLVVIFLGGCFFILAPVFSPTLADVVVSVPQRFVFMLLLVLIVLFAGLGSLFVAVREAKYSLYQILAMNIFRLVLVHFSRDLEAWGIIGALVGGYFIAVVLSGICYLQRVMPDYKIKMRIDWGKIRHIISFSISNHVASVLYQTPVLLFPPMVLEMLGKESSAYVYVVFVVATFVSGPGRALGRSALVESVHSPEYDKKIIIRASYLALGVTTTIAAGMYVFRNPLLGLFGEGYLDNAGDLFSILLLASPFVAGNLVLATYLRTKKYVKELVISSVILAIIALGIPVSLVKTMGIISIGYGWVCAQCVVIIYVLITILFRDRND